MDEKDLLAKRFEENRVHLKSVAYRMLGSATEADDAVQEVWLRLSRTDADAVENLGGWLTTVVSRICLDMLRSRKSQREESLDDERQKTAPMVADEGDPERDAMLADSVGMALMVVLETLAPPERVAFVLHDMFDLSFEEIAPIVGRTPTAARQLASRARRRVQVTNSVKETDRSRRRKVIDAFVAASRGGDFGALLAVLDPDVIVRADSIAVRMGASSEVRGAEAVARTFFGRAAAAKRALVNGVDGLAWVHNGKPRVVFDFTIANEKVVGINLIGDQEIIGELGLVVMDE